MTDSRKLRVNVISESEFTVQGHGVHTAYLEMVNALKKRTDVEVITNSRADADIVHVHTVGPYALRRLLLNSGKKVVSAHLVPGSMVGSLKFARTWGAPFARYLKFFYNKADLVLAVSDEVKQELVKLGVRPPIEVMYNSIDTSRYRAPGEDKTTARHNLNISGESFVVMCSGQVQPRKRFDTFVRLARKLPDITFIWVGGVPFKYLGDDYNHIQKQLKKKPDNLTVTGVVEFEKVAEFYKAADVFLLPSAQETFGLVVVEAAASGLPVVVRDIPDFDHTFKDDVLRGDDTTFAEIIQKLQRDTKYYKTYQQKSARIAERFDSQTATEKLVTFYRRLLRK